MLIKNATILSECGSFVEGDILTDGENILSVGSAEGSADIDAAGLIAIPGLVDIHTHGCGFDESFDGADAPEKVARMLALGGTTSYLPTSRGMDIERLISVTAEVADFIECGVKGDCAEPIGINLEGPFISMKKSGVHPKEFLSEPDGELFSRLKKASKGHIMIMTVAPELDGAEQLIKEAVAEMTVSLGHTAADYETAVSACGWGVAHATHLFNAMPPLGHREPAVVGAVFDSETVTAELICDGEHLSPSLVRLAFKALGAERTVLVSDSVAGAGLPVGEYEFRGIKHKRDDGAAVRLADGSLAGGGGFLLDDLRSAVEFGIPFADAVRAASLNPARVIGMDNRIGSIGAGKRADILLLSSDLELVGVILRGKPLF